MRTRLSMSITVRGFRMGIPIRHRPLAEITCPDTCRRTWQWGRRLGRIFLCQWMRRIFRTRADCWITALRSGDFTITIRGRFMGRSGTGFTFRRCRNENRRSLHSATLLHFRARAVQIRFEKCLGSNRPFIQQPPFPCNDPLLFVIPSEAEGSAVPRTFRGNVFQPC